jgi:hypothetical protein
VVGVIEVPRVMGGTWDEWLDEVDAEEAKEVDEGGDEGDNWVFFLFNPSSFFFFCLPGGKLGFLLDFSYVWITKLENLNIRLKTIVVIGKNFWNDCCDLGEWVGCSAGDV